MNMLSENFSIEQKIDFLALELINQPLMKYFDHLSKKNLDLKYKVLLKIYNHEDLSLEEKLNKQIFENLPDNVTDETIFA